ncbi:UDP-N-acetylglucosamine 2-epimerase [Polaribacter sp. NJDZ03]|uniref:UDP-N-acetylglucosamine 2-epimerase n=1 Tax=Polaribacter sp. NJDZ03 TaxID=2855841 RepID=UPI001C49DFD8|nr:UDP-N-acetylglucosamine 2-epimerase [Polaribacter sp. NJDZ03]
MSKTKKIVFLTGTRADFGKLKSLIQITQDHTDFEVHIFVTGMHLDHTYGYTVNEIIKSDFKNIHQYENHGENEFMDRVLAKTITGFSEYVANLQPNLVIVHGDRVEALAGSIVASMNNILVAHIEGGEISGTIDELIRHSVSKLSHIHLVANEEAQKRLIQMGELPSSIFVIGSPDLDLMNPESLPSLDLVKKYYEIDFSAYTILMYHPVTTDFKNIKKHIKEVVDAAIESGKQYVVIYPNNDLGSNEILEEYKRIEGNKNFKIYPSLRFEYFLTLLKNAELIIGNSSAGIREAPFYNVPTIDIGTRQSNRAVATSIVNVAHDKEIIKKLLATISVQLNETMNSDFGNGKSDELFLKLLQSKELWKTNCQKQFQDL